MYEALWNVVCFISLTLGVIANVRISFKGKDHDTPV